MMNQSDSGCNTNSSAYQSSSGKFSTSESNNRSSSGLPLPLRP